ncbi:hypothetical protein ARMGADRAFT_1040174 [Armillaria gallica]|uniref:Uncharacterized protein n=1 Tax=Armillaria gallica TaxID=47427 RepID=A0A2H3CW00_ARMGA|nr:hypothetical protein ARMGADRAFT_1040174 [Armillaria gallica]
MSSEGQVQDGSTETDVSGLLKAALRLQPLRKELHILPLYGTKQRDRDDGIRGVGKWSRTYRGRTPSVPRGHIFLRGTYIGVDEDWHIHNERQPYDLVVVATFQNTACTFLFFRRLRSNPGQDNANSCNEFLIVTPPIENSELFGPLRNTMTVCRGLLEDCRQSIITVRRLEFVE